MVMLLNRYVKFVEILISSPKYAIRVLASTCIADLRTVMGRTVRTFTNQCRCHVSALSSSVVKKKVRYFPLPIEEDWRLPILMGVIDNNIKIPGFTSEELDDIKNYICTS